MQSDAQNEQLWRDKSMHSASVDAHAQGECGAAKIGRHVHLMVRKVLCTVSTVLTESLEVLE